MVRLGCFYPAVALAILKQVTVSLVENSFKYQPVLETVHFAYGVMVHWSQESIDHFQRV